MTKLNDIQKTMLNQLTESDNGHQRLIATTGAYNFFYSGDLESEPDNISFRFKGSKTANWARITLNEYDLYDLEFCKMRGFTPANIAKFENVYAEDLRDIFEDVTGLALKL